MKRLLIVVVLSLALLAIASPALADGADFRPDWTGYGNYTDFPTWESYFTPASVIYYDASKVTEVEKPYAVYAIPKDGSLIYFGAPQK